MMKRRAFFLGIMSLPLVFSACSQAQPSSSSSIEAVTDLSLLAQQAKMQNIPLMIFVSAPNCRYCHQLEKDVIGPMLKNHRYDPLVFIRRLDLGQDKIIDLDGNTKDPVKIASRYRAQMTPTLLFLSPDGEILADKIQGVAQDIDQYGGMIDARINHALRMLGNPKRIVHS